jgi:dTMP kinase
VFVTLEGPEGAGKSTAARGLRDRLEESGRTVLLTREPGAGEFGAKVREILLHGGDMPALSELFLFLADRSHHVAQIIRPALERGEVVICDRFADSTVVYQGHARGLDLDELRRLNALATQGLMPDATLLFDLPAEEGLKRLQNPDRMDALPLDFHRRVRDGFLTEEALDPARWRRIDASQPADHVLDACWQELRSILQ